MIKPKKSLGQNFLIDNNILDKIIVSANLNGNHIVEIGPGTGNLTQKIIEKKPKSLVVIEKDQRLTDGLKRKFKKYNNFKIFNEDVLKFNLEKIVKINSIIIGNLPYNISSQILVKLIKFKRWLPRYKRLVLMFQKEVADKILAKYNTQDYGRISVITSSRLKIIDSFSVSPNSFYPVPKVRSKVLIFEPFINKNFNIKNIENLEKISHIFFSKKRKMINKGFNELFSEPLKIAKEINLDLNLRPKEISEEQYLKITELFEKKLK
jgi:16S rRNA (adenine1518-N6/adenine1519-N6)-dimethyltransferase